MTAPTDSPVLLFLYLSIQVLKILKSHVIDYMQIEWGIAKYFKKFFVKIW